MAAAVSPSCECAHVVCLDGLPPNGTCDCAGPPAPGICVKAYRVLGLQGCEYLHHLTYLVRNATHLPCAWNRTTAACETPPTIVHDDADVVRSLKRTSTDCLGKRHGEADMWFPDTPIQLRGARFQVGAQLPRADTDLLMLVDVWGFVSVGHATHDNLFPIAVTARMLLGVSLASIALSQPGARVTVGVVSSQSAWTTHPGGPGCLRASCPTVAWRYLESIWERILGGKFLAAKDVPAGRYDRIALGNFKAATPVRYPFINMHQVRYEAHAQLFWAEFQRTLRMRMGFVEPRLQPLSDPSSPLAARDEPASQPASQPRERRAHGVWFRRERTHKDTGNERHWSQEAFDALQSTACGEDHQAPHAAAASSTAPLTLSYDGSGATTVMPQPATPMRAERSPSADGITRPRPDGSCWLLARDPGRLNFREQAEMMRDAAMASGFEGSAFVNALFMPPGGECWDGKSRIELVQP